MNFGGLGALSPEGGMVVGTGREGLHKSPCHVARLIGDILHLSPEEMQRHFIQAGVHFEVVQGAMMPGCDESMFMGGEIEDGGQTHETEMDIHEAIVLLERHMGFFQGFSPNASKTLMNNFQFQRYREHLRGLSLHFSKGLQDAVQNFFSKEITPQASFSRSLNRYGILPEQVLTSLNESGHDYRFSGVPLRVLIAYSGINSFKKMFEVKLTKGANLLGSHESEMTEARILSFLRVELLSALDFLTSYLEMEHVRTFIKNEYGDNILRSLFEGIATIRQRYMEMTGSDETVITFTREGPQFYREYSALAQRIFDLEIIPQRFVRKDPK